MMQFLLFGTFWFWALIVISIIVVIRLAETFEEIDDDTHEYWAGLTVLLTIVLIVIFGNWEYFKKIILFIRDNPFVIVGYVLIYIVIGIAWSFLKWYGYLRKNRESNRLYFEIRIKAEESTESLIPKFSNNISRIVSWTMYWPFSALWTILHNFLRDIYTFLAEQLKGAYEKIINHVFKEFETKEERK